MLSAYTNKPSIFCLRALDYLKLPSRARSIVEGCTDPTAFDFNERATTFTHCSYELIGCTDRLSLNFVSAATTDSGLCVPRVHLERRSVKLMQKGSRWQNTTTNCKRNCRTTCSARRLCFDIDTLKAASITSRNSIS